MSSIRQLTKHSRPKHDIKRLNKGEFTMTEEQLRQAGYTEEQLQEAGFGPLQHQETYSGCPWGNPSGADCHQNMETGLCNQECLNSK